MLKSVKSMCEEKVKLMEDYHRATEVYMDSVTVLSAKIDTAPKAEYERLRAVSDG